MKRVKKKQDQKSLLPKDYARLLDKIKKDIKQTQLKTMQKVNSNLVLLYWRTGRTISEEITLEGWGAKTIDKLALDLGRSFPGVAGFSLRNLKYMRRFYETYPDHNCATAVAQIPWGHNILIMEKIIDQDQRLWYAQKTLDNGWSRSILAMWIESDLYKRQGKAITNFKATLPNPQSDLAQQSFKDPYCFDFLTLREDALEKEVEAGLINHIQSFLVELGHGFSFVGRQYHLAIGKKDYYIDLLFYHIKLRCFIVVELKAGEFDVRDAGQLNFYLSAVDDLLRYPGDNPTIGLLLVKEKDNFTAEYALRDINKPIGVAGYETKLVESLPKELKSSLPSIQEIEAELESHKKVKKTPKKTKKIKVQKASGQL